MKISKQRLLEIIREEIDNRKNNVFEFDESLLQELEDVSSDNEVPTDKTGKISKSTAKKVINKEAESDGVLENVDDVEEDALFSKTKKAGKHVLIPSKNNKNK